MNGKMTPFQRAVHHPPSLAKFIEDSAKFGVPPSEAMDSYDHAMSCEVWKNDQYQVSIDKSPEHGFGGMTLWHLSIKRIDREPLHDWRDLQEIKNQLCGPDIEAVELYPAQARVVDTSNQYHLWCFMADGGRRGPMMPMGWTAGMILEPDSKDGSFDGMLAKQRPGARRS